MGHGHEDNETSMWRKSVIVVRIKLFVVVVESDALDEDDVED